ncbi:MAG: hypothetical protein ABF242_01790 [Flavobacteriales bacterium]
MKLKAPNLLKQLMKEKYIFLLCIVVTLIPVLFFRFFPTLDGAAHLYNSNLLNEIFFESNPTISSFFVANNKPVPNLTGHIILSFFNLFLPAFLAEKAFLILYITGLSYSFRSLIKAINRENKIASYFIFPFVYSFVFILGFYNFSIALVFLLITLSYWISLKEKPFDKTAIAKLFLLLSLTFFSHIFVFAVLLMSLGILFLVTEIKVYFTTENQKKTILKTSFKKFGALLVSALIPFLLFVHYFYSRPPANKLEYLPQGELIDNLFSFRALLSYNSYEENQYLEIISTTLLALFFLAIFSRMRLWISDKKIGGKKISFFKIQDLWLIISSVLLIMYFTLADSTSYGGFVTTRVSLVLYLTIILWIAANSLPKWVLSLAAIAVFYAHFHLVSYYGSITKNLNNIALDCEEASSKMNENSVVLPLNYSDEWLALHFSNYLGIEKPLIILDNYEAVNDYFPLIWNWPFLTVPIYENIAKNNFLCIDSATYLNQANFDVDYVFVLGDINSKQDDCAADKKQELLLLTNLIFENENCQVYEFKKR